MEALQNDSLTYVFKVQDGRIVKQEVLTGETNADEVIVAHGLEEGEEVLLTRPEGAADMEFVPLPKELKEEIAQRLAEERAQRQKEARARAEAVKDENIPSDSDGGGGGFIIIN